MATTGWWHYGPLIFLVRMAGLIGTSCVSLPPWQRPFIRSHIASLTNVETARAS